MSSQQKDIESSDEEHDFILEKKETVVTSNEEIPNEEILNEEQSQKHVIKNATVFNTVELEESSDSEYEEIIIRKKKKRKIRKKNKWTVLATNPHFYREKASICIQKWWKKIKNPN